MQKKGLFELADEGTVFLDEIGDLTPGLQGKLLRFLEDRAFRRVGGVRDIQVSVRVISATNKDLHKEVQTGRFREDLYFRIKVIPIEIPPLRERAEDILPLAHHFIRHFNTELRKSIERIEPGTAQHMREYPWPGNVRELRNAIERAVLLSEGPELTGEDLPPEILAGPARTAADDSQEFHLPHGGIDLEDLERELVRQALQRTRGNRTRAARLLGMNRDQIRYRLEKYQLEDLDLEGE
jgi:DNA-binding NtrC family response regulator